MDNHTFDALTQALNATGPSRRRMLAGLLATPLALGLAGIATPADTAAKKKHKKKGKHKKHHGGGGGNWSGGGGGGGGDPEPDSEEAILLDLINDHRAANGKAALTRQGQLDAAADRHAQDEATHGFSDHTGSDGSSPEKRIADAGYAANPSGENIYYNSGDGSAATAFDWWKHSDGHNKNMLSTDYNFTQIGIARAQSESTGYWYWVTDFASPA
jgi:uncharacterized protein YkwD